MLSPSLEDYLEEIYNLSKINRLIRVRDIGNRLNVSSPSVVKALIKLNKEGYVKYKKYHEILLTKKGERLGALLVRRNKILQEFLEVINSNCNKEKEAESMEHYLSSPTIKSIENLVEFMREEREVTEKFKRYCDSVGEFHWSEEIDKNAEIKE
ncbi:MAG: DNA-binding protein [Anaeromicrobium sp.]|uniref:metal-dependent transcriptional regulator n=1 Tax=Anaeromicrobium sp. TaxID=1929132 RepID=UPI0025F477E8|nr:iron dependent repressor, metal binding and dimerization domain protein [Anaeromicrobium sp.]MCT4595485.1 DNA-binding protein [Anaeromicrobium sp.]